MTIGDARGPDLQDVTGRLEALSSEFRDEIWALFSNRVIEALERLDGQRLDQFLALNVPQLVLSHELLPGHAHNFGQRAIARLLCGQAHLLKGIRTAVDGLNIVHDAAGEIVSCSSRTLSRDRCLRVLAALRNLLEQFDAAGGQDAGLSSADFGLPPLHQERRT